MISAEKWYEYQKSYNKYGFDMKPRVTRKQKQIKATSATDRGRLLKVLAIIGVICIGIVISSAFAASLNYSNNKLKDENAALQGEVETLQIQIQSANNVAKIENSATGTLGMVYAQGTQFVNVDKNAKVDKNLGATLKQNAFN